MGYLTTLTIYNDGIDVLPDHSEYFAKRVLDASREAGMTNRPVTFGVGMFCNLVTVQVPHHADHHTLYVHMGNAVFEMTSYSESAKDILHRNPEFFERAVNFLEGQLEDLKAMQAKAKKQAETAKEEK